MLAGIAEFDATRPFSTDICIVGAGAAGITLALALSEMGRTVLLVESGNLDPGATAAQLNKGESAGMRYDIPEHRQRCFGGTTHHWGGWCVPFSTTDFQERDWMPDCRWPVSLRDIEPYYVQASHIVDIGPPNYRSEDWAARIELRPPASLMQADSPYEACLWQISAPTRFGSKFRDAIAKAPSITAVMDLTVTQIVTDSAGQHVNRLEAAALNGNRYDIRAKDYVICLGGVENARLLLLSNRHDPRGVGNRHDNVGRHFMEHVATWVAMEGFVLEDHPEAAFWKRIGEYQVPAGVSRWPAGGAKSLVAIEEEGHAPREPRIVIGTSLRYEVQRRLRLPQFWAVPNPEVQKDPRERAKSAEMLDALFGGKARAMFRIEVPAAMEQLPNRASRVTLGQATDALGQRVPRIDWRLLPGERQRFATCLELFARQLTSTGLGRARLMIDAASEEWIPIGGSHQMGSTRMSAQPRDGVVDANQRVHGMDNLFVGGSSVFATAGFGNPTLSIVAMSLRLAQHIGRDPDRAR